MPKMDERITIQRVTETRDDLGGVTQVWEDHATAWAEVRPGRGGRAWEAMRTAQAAQYNAIMRWRGDSDGQPFITHLDRVIWRGRTYAIDAVAPWGSRKSYMQLALSESETA